MSSLFQFLKRVYFFRGLSEEEIRAIQEVCHSEHVPAEAIIFEEGSKADRFYIIERGSVEVWKDYRLPEPDLLAVHEKGHLFGEMALIDDLPRSATVVARKPTDLFYINRADFHQIILDNARIAVSILISVSAMVRTSNESFVEGLRRRNRDLERANQALREAQEELLVKDRLSTLGKFSSLVLHDIRNPLSVLRGLAEMIVLHSGDRERVERNAGKIIHEADRLNRLTSELLDYSRGEIRLNIAIVDLKQFFARVVEAIEERFNTQSIGVALQVDYAGPVLIDDQRMFRVFLNLADNARKAMPEGGTLSIKVGRDGGVLRVSVADTGVGMAPEVQRKIFEPFYSFSKQGGTGLGMSIVRSVVEAHNGTLSVKSQEGKGTTFRIAIPLMD